MLVEVITSASVSGLLIWLTKSWIAERIRNAIKNEYDQKLETHKAQLKAQSDIEIEKLRSQLSIAATEHKVRFSKLYEKRARVIAQTYALLKKLYVCLGEYVNIVQLPNAPPKEEQRKAAAEAHQNFRSYYITRAIFFPQKTASKLEEIDLELVRTFNQFVIGVEMSKKPDSTNKWIDIFNRVEGEIKTALDELEDEFRRLLGDEH